MTQKIVLLFYLLPFFGLTQTASITGTIEENGSPIPGVYVFLIQGDKQFTAVTSPMGQYTINELPAGEYTMTTSFIGYTTTSKTVVLQPGRNLQARISLQPDVLQLEQITVTGTRNEVPLYKAPIIVSTLDDRVFEASQSLSMAEGLNFSPGLRIENNCQNCGFTQLRMNGLEGAYSQVLINSRPVFSALSGVYVLEMIPTSMIDRIEVVKGGGSILFGGNAIAGTVNIITKDPVDNSFEVGLNQAFVDGTAGDRTVSLNGSVVSTDLQKGISLYAFNRNREHWDANGDGYSEMVELNNTTIGLDAFCNVGERSKIKLNGYHINEYRRGGNDFDLEPHQSDVAEQLNHSIYGAGVSLETVSKKNKHGLAVYGTLQHTNRGSYYGAGGRVLQPGDSLTADDLLALNAYGKSTDMAMVTGLQYNVVLLPTLTLATGSEYQYNDVVDEMPGYERSISQKVNTIGTYGQIQWNPYEKFTLVAGGRYDIVTIAGNYQLGNESFVNNRTLNVLVPRANLMYEINKAFKLRAGYAQGYRAPQAFDEDLHIETVGGAALFTRLDPSLITERSHSYTASINYTKLKNKWQLNAVGEGFYTMLDNPFILSDQTELPSGIGVITKRNGEGLNVQGVNMELNLAYTEKWIAQLGFTAQTTAYSNTEEIWSAEGDSDIPPTTTDVLLRTPDFYGFWSVTYNPTKNWKFNTSGIYTGPMQVAHVIDPETEYTVIKTTDAFTEINLKATYTLYNQDNYRVEFFAGVQNVLNHFQDDFDIGADRDAGYVYGPARPITYFGGIKFGLN